VNNQGEEIENHYPSKILGFLDIEGKSEAVMGPMGTPTTCLNQHGALRSYSFGQI
jgi:hypothetical protein